MPGSDEINTTETSFIMNPPKFDIQKLTLWHKNHLEKEVKSRKNHSVHLFTLKTIKYSILEEEEELPC